MTSKALSEQQKVFVAELLGSPEFNVTEAAGKAGYSHPNVAGFKLLKRPQIQEAIAKAQARRMKRSELKADDVLEYLRCALFFDITDLFEDSDEGWRFRGPTSIPKEVRQLIEEINVTETVTENGTTRNVKVKTLSKSKTLDLAMRHLGLFATEKHEHQVKHSIDWGAMYQRDTEPDLIEVQIEQAGE